MKPIVLTRKFDSGRQKAVWINPEHIAYFESDLTRTRVQMVTEAWFMVRETPEQIASTLERSRAALRIESIDYGVPV